MHADASLPALNAHTHLHCSNIRCPAGCSDPDQCSNDSDCSDITTEDCKKGVCVSTFGGKICKVVKDLTQDGAIPNMRLVNVPSGIDNIAALQPPATCMWADCHLRT